MFFPLAYITIDACTAGVGLLEHCCLSERCDILHNYDSHEVRLNKDQVSQKYDMNEAY